MSVGPAEIGRVAALARLPLGPGEIERLTADLNAILAHIEELRDVDVTDVQVTSIVAAAAGPRPDDPGADPLLHGPADFAPAWQEDFFTVPRLAAMDSDDTDAPSP